MLGLIGPLGLTELLVILVIIVVIFGARRIPELGSALGNFIRNFKKSIKEDD